MVLTNLTYSPEPGLPNHPYVATLLSQGVSSTYRIKDRGHLARRFVELDRSAACPEPAEIEVMIANFEGVFAP